MPSFEAKLHALMEEVARNREVQQQEIKDRQADHDKVVEHGRDFKTVFNRLEEIDKKLEERRRMGWEIWLALISGFIALVVSVGSVVIIKLAERSPQTQGGKP